MVRASLLLLLLLLAGCGGASAPQTPNTQTGTNAPVVVQKEGALKVRNGQKTCTLDTGALAYAVYPSPDGRTLAVEAQRLSTLTLLLLYRATKEGCYRRLEPPASTLLWQKAAKRLGAEVDAIDRPRIRFLGWLGPDAYRANLTGLLEKPFDLNLTASVSSR